MSSTDRYKYPGSYWGGSTRKKEEDTEDLGYTPWWKRKGNRTYSSRLGFSEDSYSSYGRSSYYGRSFYSYEPRDRDLDNEKADVLKTAFNNSRDLVNILEFPYRLNIFYDHNGWERNSEHHRRKSNEKNIFIYTAKFLNSYHKVEHLTEEVKEECIQVISGNSIHEASHLKYTSLVPIHMYFGTNLRHLDGLFVAPQPTDYMSTFLRNLGSTNDSEVKIYSTLIYTLFNFLEDERVDTLMLEERNGWYNYISTFKEYCFKCTNDNRYTTSISPDKIDFFEFFLILVKLIRFSSELKESEILKYEDVLNYSKEYIYPKSTLESSINAFNLFKEVLIPILKEDNKSTDKLKDIIKEPEEEKKAVTLPGSMNGILKNKLITFFKNSIKVNNVFTSSDSSHILEASSSGVRCSIIDGIGVSDAALDIITGELEGDYKSSIFFSTPLGDSKIYEIIKSKVSGYIPVIRNMIRDVNKNLEFTVHGQRNGKLDTNKLAEAYQGVPQVYTKLGYTKSKGMNVCVVIDESGSMCGSSRWDKARHAAVLLNEAFKSIPGVNLYIYGHSADQTVGCDCSTELYVYKEPGGKGDAATGIGLTRVDARCENRDGHAIEAIAKRIRTKTDQPVLMFILSDGAPSANEYRGGYAIEDTKKKVEKVEKMNFYIIQITICNTGSYSEKMFKNRIDMTDGVHELPKLLGTVVRDQVVKILQDNTTTTTI